MRIFVTTNMHMYICMSVNLWRGQMAFSKMLQVVFATIVYVYVYNRLSGIGLVYHIGTLRASPAWHRSNFARSIALASWKFHKNLHEWDASANTTHYLSLSSCSTATSGVFALRGPRANAFPFERQPVHRSDTLSTVDNSFHLGQIHLCSLVSFS